MSKSLKTHKKYAYRALRAFLGGLPAALALWGFLAAAPLALAQNPAEGVGEDFVSDFFMDASEGMSPIGSVPPPPASASAASDTPPPPPPSASQDAGNTPSPPPPDSARMAGKPFPHKLPVQTAQSRPKKAGKPPRAGGTSGASSEVPANEMPVAVLEPESPSQPQAAPPDQPLAAGERPLPVPPESGAEAPADDPGGDEYFLGPDELAAGTETDANSVTMPINLGALPSLQWETTDPNAPAANFVSGAPLPQFDSSASNWKQLEIGQADVVTPPPPPERPSSVSTVTEPETAPPQGGGAATDREQLRSLFNDMLPPPGQGARPAGGAAPAAQKRPAQTAETGTPAVSAPPADPVETDGAPSATPSETGSPTVPGENPESADYEGSSAILRAGGQLSTRGHFGEAAILPPLTNAPDLAAWMEAQKAREAPKAAETKTTQQPPAKEDPAPPAKSPATDGGAPPKAKPGATAPIVRSQLTLVNETGNDRMLDIYRSVLTQMGYTIVSAETRPPAAAPTGQTIITYRPGAKAKARGVAAHLPGRKTLVEAPAAMPTEISIFLR